MVQLVKNTTNPLQSFLNRKVTDEPGCEIKDILENNSDLIFLTGNYKDFFGKLFQTNKIKDFNEIISLLKKKIYK